MIHVGIAAVMVDLAYPDSSLAYPLCQFGSVLGTRSGPDRVCSGLFVSALLNFGSICLANCCPMRPRGGPHWRPFN